MNRIVYLDNSATTKPCAASIKMVKQVLEENWGNPSSLHSMGMKAEIAVQRARSSTARLIGCNENEIFFTSGGTEANNLAIIGAAQALKRRGNRIVTTEIEHSSVKESVDLLEKQGFEVVRIKPDKNGNIDSHDITSAINKDTILVSIMQCNNEIGSILPVSAAKSAVIACDSPALIHCDAVQAFGKIPVLVRELAVDLLTLSSHKIHGPTGCGVLYKSKKARIIPRQFGGEQQQKIRSGTECVSMITGFAAALDEVNVAKAYETVKMLNNYARERLRELNEVVFNSDDNALPYILNISLKGYKSETILHFLELRNIFISSGSACAGEKVSHVLKAMEIGREMADSALRISFCKYNNTDDIDALVLNLKEAIITIKTLK